MIGGWCMHTAHRIHVLHSPRVQSRIVSHSQLLRSLLLTDWLLTPRRTRARERMRVLPNTNTRQTRAFVGGQRQRALTTAAIAAGARERLCFDPLSVCLEITHNGRFSLSKSQTEDARWRRINDLRAALRMCAEQIQV